MKLSEQFNIKDMTDDQLFRLFYIGQQMADVEDKKGNTEGCLEFSELWCAVEDLLKERGWRS